MPPVDKTVNRWYKYATERHFWNWRTFALTSDLQTIKEELDRVKHEVAQEISSMYTGIFIGVPLAFLCFGAWKITGQRPLFEMALVAVCFTVGWIVRSQALFHAPDVYVRAAGLAITNFGDDGRRKFLVEYGTWDMYRPKLKWRGRLLVVGNLFAAFPVWWMIGRYFVPTGLDTLSTIALVSSIVVGGILIPISAFIPSVED